MALEGKRVTLVVDPRFSGGTSTAVAQEIWTLSRHCILSVAAIEAQMFKGQTVHPAIEEACFATGTPLIWNPLVVSADLVAVHNPSFLKFNESLELRIFCDHLCVVCHENFLGPGGAEGFDVKHCLGLIERCAVARVRQLAPISSWNRHCTETWCKKANSRWNVTRVDWANICEFELIEPTPKPRDKRGRHSRPGFEKFPSLSALKEMFPATCEQVRILGADMLELGDIPTNWELLSFGSENVAEFLQSIDFVIYFTNEAWRESFGRSIAEALAAGKVVITDADTGETFGNGVVKAEPCEVNSVVMSFLKAPESYAEQVRLGHTSLAQFSAKSFLKRVDMIHADAGNEHLTVDQLYAIL